MKIVIDQCNELLLPEEESPSRCWCCWETSETKKNPLIRSCLSCKNKDLQLIHQDCIDQFINTLPQSDHYTCARCGDVYFTECRRISPFQMMLTDPILCISLVLMVICMFVLNVCIILLFTRYFDAKTFLSHSNAIRVSLSTFSLVMFVFSHIIHIMTWKMVWKHFDGHFKIKVLASL